MADTLTSKLTVTFQWAFKESLDLATVTDAATLTFTKSLEDGTAVDTADLVWHDQASVTSGTPTNHDMTALSSTLFGTAVTYNFAKVKMIMIENTSTTTGEDLQIGGNANGLPFTSDTSDVVICGPSSCCVISNLKDGFTVTGGTGDIVQVAAASGTITYNIAILGTTA